MTSKNTTLAGGFAVAALLLAGTVAAQAANEPAVEKVSYFEVQHAEDNPTPAGWFSEQDDDVAAVTFGLDGAVLAASSRAVGLNKLVDVPFTGEEELAIEATGSTKYSLVVVSDEVEYMRITATDSSLEAWFGNGYFPADGSGRVYFEKTQTLAQWAAEDFLGDDARIVSIGARHHSGEGVGTLKSLTFDGVRYEFGLVKDETPFDQGDVDEAVLGATAPLQEQIARLQQEKTALQGQLSAAEKAARAAEKAARKAEDNKLKAQAAMPFSISGTLKVGKTLTAKGKSYAGISVSYRWEVGGKKAGTKASLKLKKAHAGKSVRLVVTKTYRKSSGAKVTVKQTVKPTVSAGKVSR